MALTAPFEQRMKDSKRVMLFGIGGGYDVFTTVPLFFHLKALSKPDPVLVSLSFVQNLADKCSGIPVKTFGGLCASSHVEEASSSEPSPSVSHHDQPTGRIGYEVSYAKFAAHARSDSFAESAGYPQNYFPEFHLSRWFHRKHGMEVPVHALDLKGGGKAVNSSTAGVSQLAEALQDIVVHYGVDLIILCDGGVDSLLKLDEEGLGTVAEDLMSMLAANSISAPAPSMLMCVGLGTEHHISEHDFLRNWHEVQQQGGYLGSFGWHSTMPGVAEYLSAVSESVPQNTGVQTQICAALEGALFGHDCPEHSFARMGGSAAVYINPLMTQAFFFDLETVMAAKLFMDEGESHDALSASKSVTHLHSKLELRRIDAGIMRIPHSRPGQAVYSGTRPYQPMFDRAEGPME